LTQQIKVAALLGSFAKGFAGFGRPIAWFSFGAEAIGHFALADWAIGAESSG
jgi:hypothetical protein